MSRLPVNVKLVILIIIDEAATFLVDCEMCIIPLGQEIDVISVRELRAHFHRLPIARVELPQCVDVRPVALLPSFPKPHLSFADIAVQVIVNDVEVLKRRELRVCNERALDEELPFFRVDIEAIAGVEADPLADAGDKPVDLFIEIRGIVNHVKVRVADPGGRRFVVQISG